MKLKQKYKYLFISLIATWFAFSGDIYSADYPEKVQWASRLIAFSSEYSSKQNSAMQALGRPSIMSDYGKSPCAWMPNPRSGRRTESIHVGFDSLMNVQQISINENYNPGNITEIYLYDESNEKHRVYFNPNPTWISSKGRMLNVFLQRTEYKVVSLEIIIKYNPVIEGTQIDAIAITDTLEPLKTLINVHDDVLTTLKPENMGKNVNSVYNELAPVISPDGKTLFFTRDNHPENIGLNKKQDVWYSKKDNIGIYEPAKNIGSPINNSANNFVLSITPDGNAVLLGNVYEADGTTSKGVSISYNQGSTWSKPIKLNIKNFYNRNENIGGFYLANNSKILLMSVEGADSYGGLDLYMSQLENDGSWSEPLNMGKDINTAADEDSPFLASDNVTLYYATSGHCGYGNDDMFLTHRLDSGWVKWSEPENLGSKLNSSGWDAYYTIPASGDYAYFVSDKNSLGAEDIFKVSLPQSVRPKPVMMVSGKVFNSKLNVPVSAKIIYETLPDGKEVGIARSNPESGEYKIVLPSGFKYGFLAEAQGFIAINEHLDLTNFDAYKEITRDLALVPIEEGQTIRLNNIFFDFDKFTLLVDSYSELNRVAKFLNDNPDIRIEISGHTDSWGTEEYNQILSMNRANAVGQYLISKSIPKERFIIKGYGKSKPVVKNDTEENRQLNRRVEFLILKKDTK